VALVLALRRMAENGQLRRFPVQQHVAAISVGIVGDVPLLDLAYDEDSSAEVDMNIVKTSDGRYIELQGTAEKTPFDRARLGELLELADQGISRLVAIQQSVLGPLS
jgi:ribonuclease PH